jgi:Arc-like DNA binding domain
MGHRMPRKIPRLAQTKIRLPHTLRRDLQRAADGSKRPLNAEIIWRLQASFVEEKAARAAAREILEKMKASPSVLEHPLGSPKEEIATVRKGKPVVHFIWDNRITPADNQAWSNFTAEELKGGKS